LERALLEFFRDQAQSLAAPRAGGASKRHISPEPGAQGLRQFDKGVQVRAVGRDEKGMIAKVGIGL